MGNKSNEPISNKTKNLTGWPGLTFYMEMNMSHKLTNRDISEQYSKSVFWISSTDFLSAMAYWVIYQSSEWTNCPKTINQVLFEFDQYVNQSVLQGAEVGKFEYEELRKAINEKAFESIPAIAALNESQTGQRGDFVDLGALARNVFYMLLRLHICDGDD